MKNLERYGWMAIVAALIVLLFLQQCNQPAPCPGVIPGKADTVYLTTTDTIQGKPLPVAIIKKQAATYLPDTGHQPSHICPADYYEYGCSWQSIYSDTTKTAYGNIVIEDTISNNLIQHRKVITNLSIPQITRVDTVHKNIYPKTAQVYLGIDAIGASRQQLFGVGPSISFKTKKEKIITATAFFTRNGWVYQAGYKWKLSLFKK